MCADGCSRFSLSKGGTPLFPILWLPVCHAGNPLTLCECVCWGNRLVFMSFVKFYLIFESFLLVKSLIFVFHACDLHNLHKHTDRQGKTQHTHRQSWPPFVTSNTCRVLSRKQRKRRGMEGWARMSLLSARMRYILWMQIPVHSDLVYLLAGGERRTANGGRLPFFVLPLLLFACSRSRSLSLSLLWPPPFRLLQFHVNMWANLALVPFFIHSHRIFIHAISLCEKYRWQYPA